LDWLPSVPAAEVICIMLLTALAQVFLSWMQVHKSFEDNFWATKMNLKVHEQR